MQFPHLIYRYERHWGHHDFEENIGYIPRLSYRCSVCTPMRSALALRRTRVLLEQRVVVESPTSKNRANCVAVGDVVSTYVHIEENDDQRADGRAVRNSWR